MVSILDTPVCSVFWWENVISAGKFFLGGILIVVVGVKGEDTWPLCIRSRSNQIPVISMLSRRIFTRVFDNYGISYKSIHGKYCRRSICATAGDPNGR